MSVFKRARMAIGTFGIAMAIGFVMQSNESTARSQSHALEPGPIALSDLTLTSALPSAPNTHQAIKPRLDVPDPAPATFQPDTPEPPVTPVAPTKSCAATLQAVSLPAAMVDLTLEAPCETNERLTLHHNGMMFSGVTDENGAWTATVPALSENAIFIASFGTGRSAVTKAMVPEIISFDRAVVQWDGPDAVELHALEFGATYFTDGHVGPETPRDAAVAATGDGGFLTILGEGNLAGSRQAQVYTFPAGLSKAEGDVDLSVDVAVTFMTCERLLEAQTLEVRAGGRVRVQDLSLNMPGCDAVGDYLVLKNILDPLTIAQK